jgi:hypothetical protein
MSLAVPSDYFSFMSDKLDSRPVPEDLDVVVQRVEATVRPDVIDWVQASQMEVTESPPGDAVIERIFNRRPNDA